MQPEMYTGPVIQGRRTAVSLNRFMMKVYGLLSFMFLASGIGAMWGMNQGLSVVGLHPILLAIAMFGTLFLLMAVQKVPGVNLIVTTFFATLMGASLGPMLFALLRTANGGAILSDALFLTMAIFFSLSIYAIVSGKSFSFMGSFHLHDPGRVQKPFSVLLEAKHMGSLCSLVGTDSLENSHSVVERVGQNMDVGLLPWNHPVIHPDPATFFKHSNSLYRGQGTMSCLEEKGPLPKELDREAGKVDQSSPLKISNSLRRLTKRLNTSR